MPDLNVGIVLRAVDRATAPLKGLSRSAGGTRTALAKLGGQAAQVRKLGGLQSSLGSLGGKLDVSRKKTAELGRALKSVATPSAKLRGEFERSQRQTVALARAHGRQRHELRDLSTGLRRAGIDTRNLAGEQARLERSSGQLSRRLDRLSKTPGSRRTGGRGLLGGFAGGLVGSAAFAGFRGSVRSLGGFVGAASKLETLETTLGTIEGSSKKAKVSMGWIKNFTKTTPFQIDQVSEAFVKLRAYGMDPTTGLLRTLGDTASGMGKDVMQAVEAIADAVVGENERLKEFGVIVRTTGDTVTYTLRGETRTADKNSPIEIQRALLEVMNNSFGGAMQDRMKTFAGLVSNLGDEWFLFRVAVMESGPFEVLKARLRGVLGQINALAASGELEKLADRVGGHIVKAFEGFERDVWPVLKDEVWPALKGVAGVVWDILKGVNQVASAMGGWGNVIRVFALYKGLKMARGGLRMIGGGVQSIRDFGGVGSLRGPKAGKLAGTVFGALKTGGGKALGGLAGFGRTLGSLALRFAPLAIGALKAVGVAIAGLSLPVTATVAAIAAGAYLVWKHWEPISKFFSKLWEGIKSAFSSAWEKLSSIDWGGLGKRLLLTLAKGIKAYYMAPWNALKWVLGKVSNLLPESDARAGPLSKLTASGASILSTMGLGAQRYGAPALQQSLSRALGAAVTGLPLTATPALEGRPASDAGMTVNIINRITIEGHPGESSGDLVDRLLHELERRQGLAVRGALGRA